MLAQRLLCHFALGSICAAPAGGSKSACTTTHPYGFGLCAPSPQTPPRHAKTAHAGDSGERANLSSGLRPCSMKRKQFGSPQEQCRLAQRGRDFYK